MKTHKPVAGLILLAFLAGCTADWDPGRRNSQAVEHPVERTGAAERTAPAGFTSRPRAFAALPDRGELLAYDRNRGVRHRGAYTSHPIRLSEEHAFRASQAGGELVVAAPNGELIRLGYERHVEHPDGNWTWIGRTDDGADAVLTFGEKAVFGTVPYRDQEPLRITTTAGGAWLVATDRSKLPPDINRATTRTGKPDYLIPPRLSASQASSASGVGMAAQDVSAAAAATVDVVLGYTNGYAAANGGASAAVTRLNNLVQVANQAMVNSLVTRRLRLVRTVQVNYPDATNNTTALEELTGYRNGQGISVPAALQPLRNARDEYGGDLVALVRDFRAPENDGCGIAWLIGGGQEQFTTGAAPFGYSVVSDGTDVNEQDGNNYFCRNESLAHELGHNMGQAHDVDNSDGLSGAHPYSYGYRESSPTGFFTVMAYASGNNQTGIRYFANPAVTVSGRPTGVANASDNTRSLNLTMPVVINFRAAVVPAQPARHDINGDGRSDLLLRYVAGSSRSFGYWAMNGASITRTWSTPTGTAYSVVATGDFNGDGRLDIVWTSAQRDVKIWFGNGTSFGSSQHVGTYPAGWSLIGAGDVDGDGRSDLLLRYAAGSQRRFGYWIMNGASITRTWSTSTSAAYSVVTTGDFNGDDRLDIVWTSAQRDVKIWFGTGTSFAGSPNVRSYPAGWSLIGAGDIDGDGRSDLLLRYASGSGGKFGYWAMNGASITRTWSTSTGTTYSVATTGDFNGDGFLDIVWTSAQRDVKIWFGNGTSFGSSQHVRYYPAGWSLLR